MADNLTITAGTGTTIAADEIGGAKYQRVKISVGADGAAADLAPGQGLMAASLPVAIASNQSAVPVTLGAETTKVIGTVNIAAAQTVTANLSATDNAVLDSILATAGATNGAKVITDADGTQQQYLRGIVSLMADTTPSAVKDAGPNWTSVWTQATSADATGKVAVTAAPTSGQKICIDDIILSVGATAMTVTFEEETSATAVLVVYMPATSTLQITPRGKIKLATADKKLMIDTSAAGAVSVTTTYHSEA